MTPRTKKNSVKATSKKARVATMMGFGAVAVGGLFTASDADADIVYSGVLNATLNMSTAAGTNTAQYFGHVFQSATNGRTMFALAGQARGPSATYLGFLSGGARIDFPSAPNQAGGALKFSGTQYSVGNMQVFNSTSSVSAGQSASTFVWADAGLPGTNLVDPLGIGNTGTGTGFFGFSFSSTGGQRNQGWGRISISVGGGRPISFTIVDYAYENNGGAIHVADTTSIPEPATAGLLALAAGAAGMRRYRKQKKVA